MSLRYAYSLALLSLTLLPLQAAAQGYYADDVITSDASGSVYGANMSLGIPGGYFWARGDYGERPGVNGNYFSTGAFAPANIWGPNQISFVEGQIFVNDQMGPGGDIGLGHRYVGSGLFGNNFAIGANGFLTWDETVQGSRNRRGSAGVEFLSDYIHANANYYIPIDTSPDRIGNLNRTKEALFVGTNLVYLNRQMAEQQMKGADFEVGVQVPTLEWITVSGGGYYFDSHVGKNVTGTTAKVGIDLTSAILDVTYQKDSLFGTTINVGTEIRAGSNGIVIAPNFRNLNSKIYDRVRKRARIAVQQVELVDQELAINPATGLPYNIIHVDNTAAAGGDGSNEARFNTLDLANGPMGDIILVHRGDTTRANLLAGGTGLNLDNNQIIIGEGTPFLLQSANRPIACPLPGVDQMGTNPFVTANAGSNVIDLANNNQVLGLNIISPTGGNAIGGLSVSNFVIDTINKDITPGQDTGAGGGIMLRDATSMGQITNYSFIGTDITTAPGGIVIQNSDVAKLDLMIDNAPVIQGGRYGIDLVADNSIINAQIDDVHANMNGTGIRMDARDGGRVNTIISNSNFDNALNGSPETGDGIAVLGSNGGVVNTILTNVTAINAVRDSLHVGLNASNANVTMINGNLTGATDDTVDARLMNGANLNLTLTNTPGGMAGDTGLAINADMNSHVTAILNSSNFTPVGGDGINTVLTNNSTANITATNSSFAGAGKDGLFVNSASGSSFTGSFANGSFANAMEDGVDLTFANSVGNTLVLNNTDANNALGGNGFKFSLDSASAFNASLTDVSLDNAMASAINGNVQNGSNAVVNGTRVSGIGAGDDAIRSRTNLNSQLTMTLNESGSFAGAMADGLDLGTTNGSTSVFNISGAGPVDFSAASGFGLISQTINNSSTTLNFASGANFNGAGNDAMMVTSINGSVATLTGPNFSGMGAGGDGISLLANNSLLTANLTNIGDFSGVTGDGIQYTGTNGADLSLTFSGVPGTPGDFTDAGARGLNGSLTDSTAVLNLTDTNFNRAGAEGLMNTSDNSMFTANLTNSSFAAATGTALGFDQSNASNDVINIDDVDAFSSSTGHGLFVNSQTGSTADVNVTANGFNLVNSALDAINLTAAGMSTITFDGSNVHGTNAGDDGIDLNANNSRIDFTIASTGDFGVSGGDGLIYQGANNAVININLTDTSLNDNMGSGTGYGARGVLTGSTATVNMTNVTMNNAGVDGFSIESDNSIVTSALNTITMNDAGGNAFNISSTNVSDVSVTGTALSGMNAGNDGIHIVHDSSTTDIQLTNVGSFAGAVNDGVNAVVSNGSYPDFNLDISGVFGDRANFSSAGNDGISLTFNNFDSYNAMDPVFTIDEANFGNAGNNGFNLASNGVSPGMETTFNGLVTNSSFNFAGNHGIGLVLSGNDPFSRLLFDTITATNATVDGVNVFASNNTFLDLDILTLGGGGAGLAGAGDDIQDVTTVGGSTVDINVD